MATTGKNESRSSTTELLPEVPKAVVQPDFTLNHYEFDHVHSNFDMNASPRTGKAIGGFSFTGAPGNGEALRLIDALGTIVDFSTDTSSTDVSGAIISFSGGAYRVTVGTSGASSATRFVERFVAAINATQIPFYVGAAIGGEAQVNLIQQITGPHGNTPIASTLSNVTIDHSGTFVRGSNHSQPPFSKRFQLVRPVANSGLAMSRNGHTTQG